MITFSRINKLTVLLLFLLYTHPAMPQTNDKAIAIAHYEYTHLMDTTKKDDFYKEEMRLLLGQNATLFSSAELIDDTDQFNVNPTVVSKNGETWIQAPNNRYYDPQELYIFHKERKLFVFEKLINTFFYENPYPQINWTILNNTQIINDLKCQEAKTNYKGREWIVWFCPEIPFTAGPWHLNGLPGLIINANDSKNEITYKMISFEKIESDPNQFADNEFKISLLDKANQMMAIKTTALHVERLWNGYKKNPSEFIKSQRRGPGTVQDILQLEALALKPICNNPIALKD